MSRWNITINIKDLLTEDDSESAVVFAVNGINDRLRPLLGTSTGTYDLDTLNDILESFEEIATNSQDADEFNEILNELYDWADDNRVWLGL